MTRPMVVASFMMLSLAGTQAAQTPPRAGVGVTPTTGTASISGRVVSDEEPARPVRRAVVTLTGAGLVPDRSAITDDEGRFTIVKLPAGRFVVTAMRASFITSAYGARRPSRPGTAIPVAEAEEVQNLIVKLWRGAAIAGVIRDESGRPVVGVPVLATPARAVDFNGMMTVTNNGAATDDRGEYRIFGLEPGTYVVSARPAEAGGGPLFAPSEAEVDAILSAVQLRASGVLARPPPARTAATSPAPSDYAPIFFPGTASLAAATPITLAAAQEMTGLDFALQRVPTEIVEGVVTRPDGSPARGAAVEMAAVVRDRFLVSNARISFSAATGNDGQFRIPQVPPGDYQLVARAPAEANRPAALENPAGGVTERSLWVEANVSVAGQPSRLALQLEPGLTVSGNVAFDGAAQPPADLTRIKVWLRRLTSSGIPVSSSAWIAPTAVRADGSFVISNLVPGPCVLTVEMPGAGGMAWWARSAMAGSRDLLDGQTEMTRETAATRIVVTLTDRHTELSGTLLSGDRAPVSDVFIIAYAADRRLWGPEARRVRAVRPGIDGRYSIKDLPPGEYLLGAVTDADQDEWQVPAFLEKLVATSAKVSLGDGDRKVLDLTLGGGR